MGYTRSTRSWPSQGLQSEVAYPLWQARSTPTIIRMRSGSTQAPPFVTHNEHVMRATSLALLIAATAGIVPCVAAPQAPGRASAPVTSTLLVPDRVWDGMQNAPHSGWAVLVTGNRIVAAGPRGQITALAGATTINLPGTTLLPG